MSRACDPQRKDFAFKNELLICRSSAIRPTYLLSTKYFPIPSPSPAPPQYNVIYLVIYLVQPHWQVSNQ